MANVDPRRGLLIDKKRGVHLPTRERFRSMPRKSVYEKNYLESLSSGYIFPLIVCFCNDEFKKPSGGATITRNSRYAMAIFIAPHNCLRMLW